MEKTRNTLAIAAPLLAVVVSAVSAVIVVVSASGAPRSPTTAGVGLRAKLTATGAPARRGLFVGSLRSGTLSWGVAYRGLSGGSVRAQIRLGKPGSGGAVAATLCTACRRQMRGRRVVGERVARALAGRQAYVEIVDRDATARRIAGRVAVASIPTLEVTYPKAGETFDLPASVGYRVTGLDLDQTRAFLAVYVAGYDGRRVEIPLSSRAGAVSLPDAKDAFLVGHRDLTFQLETADRVLVPNAEAIVVVRDLTITGRRSG